MRITTALPETQLITGEAFYAMGDIGACELIDGRIVAMTPAGGEHGGLESDLVGELVAFVRGQKRGRVVSGETGIYTRRNPDRVRGVDIAVISRERLPGALPRAFLEVAPELVVEIVSPSDSWTGVRQKIEEYFAIGVEQVWIVEPENRTVLVYRSATSFERLGEADTLRGSGLLEGFSLPLATLFSGE